MKKLAFTLLFALAGICTLSAQNTQSDIMSYLRTEGYAPQIDQDGDVMFKVQGLTWYAIVKEIADDGFAYVEIRVPFGTTSSLTTLTRAATDLNRQKYLCKCIAFSDGSEENTFQVGMEFATASRANTELQMKLAIDLIPNWIDEVSDIL